MPEMMSDQDMQRLLEQLQDPSADDFTILDAALEKHVGDARLHFLRASTSVANGKLIEAHRAFKQTIELAPDFHIARFQFGFFQLTSGEADEALKTWAPLGALPKDHYLTKFVSGLRHLIRDEFPETINNLKEGISLNDENLPLNADMQIIIGQVEPLLNGKAGSSETKNTSDDESSLTSLLLQQSSNSLH